METDICEFEDDVVWSVFDETQSENDQLDADHEHTSQSMENEEIEEVPRGTRQQTTFLDLPKAVQRRILEYAGLLRPCLINFVSEKYRAKHDRGLCSSGAPVRLARPTWTAKWMSLFNGTCDHPALPVDVFLASHAVREELGALFFGHNRIAVSLIGRQEYKYFSMKLGWGLLHLKRLHILLGGQDRYLKNTRGVHRTVWSVWSDFCERAPERMPALKYFSLKAKVKDPDVASRLMSNMDPFPILAQCAFHFGDQEYDEIRPVMKQATRRLTSSLSEDEGRSPFRFAKLPPEIQSMILEHVLTQHSDPYLPASDRDTGMVGFLDRKSRRTTHSPLACCGTCSPVGSTCFCGTRQTAFSTSCSCFSSPLPYFLVNRQFYAECRRIFFLENHFRFIDDDPEAIMRFLNSIPTHSFMQIRHLSFKFPMNYRLYLRHPRTEDSILLSWSVLRRFIREHFDLSRLSLTIVDPGTRGSIVYRNKYLRRMLTTFTAELQGLRDFHVSLADDPSFEEELENSVLGRITAVEED
ncbi:uncharacterized protein BDV14DRAFT_200380 [Aspergillus stella-maris]|uniref:uncharacterized protein n=1 Tax=Aspergillus stella-maris TaxID=1810926 RepID=UPI003CCE4598